MNHSPIFGYDPSAVYLKFLYIGEIMKRKGRQASQAKKLIFYDIISISAQSTIQTTTKRNRKYFNTLNEIYIIITLYKSNCGSHCVDRTSQLYHVKHHPHV